MANAWIIPPLVPAGATTLGSLQAGIGSNLFNDYAGVVCQLACDDTGNRCVVRIDLGADTAIDTLMVFGVELFPSGGTVQVAHATAAQGNFSGASTAEPAVPPSAGSVAMTSGKSITLWSADTPVTARYWQIAYLAGSAGKAARLSRIVIGKRIQLERNFGFGGTFGVRDLGSLDFSARGVLLRRRAKKLRTAALTFSNEHKDEVETLTKPLIEQIGNTEMIALVTDPSVDPQRQNRCYFGPLVGDLGHTWRNAAAWEAKVNLVSIF